MVRRKIKVIAVLLVFALSAMIAACTSTSTTQKPTTGSQTGTTTSDDSKPAKSIVWKWTTTEIEGTPYWDEWKSIFDELTEKTNGEIVVEMYPGGAITGSEMEILQGVQQGSIEMAQISASILENIVPEYGVLNLPFIFDSFEHMERFDQTPECKELLTMMEPHGVKQYRIGNSAFAYPNSKTPIKAPDDFKGVKWRTMEVPIQLDTMKALGAVPVAVPYGDVYNALKTNLVSGWQNAGTAFEALSTFEVARYVTELPIFSFPGTFILSTKAYNELSDKNKAIVDEVFENRLPNSYKVLYDYNMDALDVLLEEGKMELIKVDDITPFREKVLSVYESYFKKCPTAQKYYDAINACR